MMKRGEVRWYEFKAPDKRRPVVILTRNTVIPVLSELTVAPVTTRARGIPSEVVVGLTDGMPRDGAVNLDHVQTIEKKRIGGIVTTLGSERMAQIGRALAFALGFDQP